MSGTTMRRAYWPGFPKVLTVADVGHGLCASVSTGFSALQIDLGAKSPAAAAEAFQALPTPEALLISHFHIDHYSGLLHRPPLELAIEKAYFARLPDLPALERRELALAFLTVFSRAFGGRSGVPAADFIARINELNRRPWTAIPVSAGDMVGVHGATFNVIWPPRQLPTEARAKVVNAIARFKSAREADPLLEEIAIQVEETIEQHPFLLHEARRFSEPLGGNRRELTEDRPGRDLPEMTIKAAESLSNVANDLSVVIEWPERFLFLGDVPRETLPLVVSSLVARNRRWYNVAMTAHHGTHWHDELLKIAPAVAISSCGGAMSPSPEYRVWARATLRTDRQGTITSLF